MEPLKIGVDITKIKIAPIYSLFKLRKNILSHTKTIKNILISLSGVIYWSLNSLKYIEVFRYFLDILYIYNQQTLYFCLLTRVITEYLKSIVGTVNKHLPNIHI